MTWRFVLAIMMTVTGCSFGESWADTAPGTVVVHSETQVSFTGSSTCNPRRVAPDGSDDESLAVRFEGPENGAVKFCALGDCGVAQGGTGTIDPSQCRGRFDLAEPMGDRALIVNGSPVAVVDNR